jgi:hypothetical protein
MAKKAKRKPNTGTLQSRAEDARRRELAALRRNTRVERQIVKAAGQLQRAIASRERRLVELVNYLDDAATSHASDPSPEP